MNLIYSFFLNSPWLGLIAVTVVAVVAALICYAIMRTLLSSRIASDSELLSRDIIGRLGALHALILSLMFVQEMADYRYVTQIISQGVSGIRDVYNGLKEFGREDPESTRAINERLFAYAHAVVRRDLPGHTQAPFGVRTWDEYQRINRELRDLQPINDKQKDLRAQMLSDWDLVSELRQQLKSAVGYHVPAVFWLIATTGFLATVIPCFVYSPTFVNLVTLSTYAAFNGIVMYVMFSIANPFTGIAAIEFTELEEMLANIQISGS